MTLGARCEEIVRLIDAALATNGLGRAAPAPALVPADPPRKARATPSRRDRSQGTAAPSGCVRGRV